MSQLCVMICASFLQRQNWEDLGDHIWLMAFRPVQNWSLQYFFFPVSFIVCLINLLFKKDHKLVFYLWYVLLHVFPTQSILASHRWGESKINIIKQGHQIFSVGVSECFRMSGTV